MTASTLTSATKASRDITRGIFFNVAKGLKSERMTLRNYIEQAWPIVEPTNAFIPNWHIDAIAEHLEAVTLGQIQRLVINIYPRVGKSLLASVLWPTWAWTQRPWLKQIFLSYSSRLSTKFSRDRRTVIQSNWYKERWGNVVQMADDQNQKAEFENTARGAMFSTSIGGSLTGEGGDVIGIDDGIDPERAESKADRETAIRFVKNVVSTRLNDLKRGAIVEISQRTHKNDISGTLLAEGGYVHLNLPAICETKTVIEFPISKRTVIREEGDALFPARHTVAQIQDIMGRMTPRAANAQYRQKPSADDAAQFKREFWKFYSVPPEEMAKDMDEVIQSWDLSFKDLDSSDYVAGGVLGKKGPNLYVFHVLRKRMGFGATKMALRMMTAAWPMAHRKIVEDKANGPAIIEDAKREIPGIFAFSPKDSKEARAAIVAAYQEAGNIWLPDPMLPGCGWVKGFIDECEEFSASCEHDDQVDMLTQGFLHLNMKKAPSLFIGDEDEIDGDDE